MPRATPSPTSLLDQIRWPARVLSLALAAGLLALSLTPVSLIERLPVTCPSRLLLGIECYGCGMTRALAHLLHGNPMLSARFHPHATAWLALLLVLLVTLLALGFRRRPAGDSISA